MKSTTDLAGLVPGFEFLQTLMKSAGSAIPGMGQWVAPTLDPAEIEKRIQELRTVQFWLEQNATLLSTTIQALEVQRMTLATLQSMNLPLVDVRDALKIKVPDATSTAPGPQTEVADGSEAAAAPGSPPAAVDPLQWWNALTRQFGEIAAQAMKGSPAPGEHRGAADSTAAPAGASTRAPVPAPTQAPSQPRERKTAARKAAASKRA